ncbi:MAG: hypothetical protein QOJ77_1720 [Microbacteriaceae bacterium]|nr:hypothetical protein [Microbacteriaceae bacterium]
MRVVRMAEFGDASVLELAQGPDLEAGPGEVRINVVGAGVNGADISQRQGNYPPPAGAPPWLGLEVSGTVSAIGEGVMGVAVGDAVCALLPGGGYAEQAVVDAGLVLPVPSNVSVLDAAALPEVVATVWSNVFMLAQLQPGETLLVHGGTSGVGTMAIQIATALGSRVIATAGSPKKVAFIESLGATGVDYRADDFVEKVSDFTDDAGADVVLDIVGGDYLARNIRALAVGGRIMSIANRSGDLSTFSLGSLMMKRGRIWATTLRFRSLAERVEILQAVHKTVWPLIEAGWVKPIIDSTYDLSEAPAAHERMESSAHIGKILLRAV